MYNFCCIVNINQGGKKTLEEKGEYLYYIQKFLDLTDNIKDEQLKKDIIYTFFSATKALSVLAKFDIEALKK